MFNPNANNIEYVDIGKYCQQSTIIHPQYKEFLYIWTMMRDFTKGEIAVKRQNERYLPIPTGFQADGAVSMSSSVQSYQSPFQEPNEHANLQYDPNYHPISPYSQYKSGAKVPSMLAYTIAGLSGLISKKSMKFNYLSDLEKEMDKSYGKNGAKQRQIRVLINKVITYGRCVLTLDKHDNFVIYDAMSLEDWDEGLFVKLKEVKVVAGEYVVEYVRISQVGKTTVYERFDENGTLIESDKTNSYGRLPVSVIGSTDLDWDVDIVPLEGIALCASMIYKKTAELSYAEFSSCVPTLVITGADDDAKPKAIGGGVALVIPNDAARVFYPKNDSNSLQHLKIHIDALFEEAKTYGASLLAGDKAEVESAEAIRLRQAASGATLSSLTKAVENGINDLITLVNDDIVFNINFNLEENYLTEKEQTSLLNSWMSGGISYQTYFDNMQKAGIIREERSSDEELKLIEAGRARNEILQQSTETDDETSTEIDESVDNNKEIEENEDTNNTQDK